MKWNPLATPIRIELVVATRVASFALTGCASSSDSDSQQGTTSPKTNSVPVKAAHALSGDDRTIRIIMTPNDNELGTGTYSTAGKEKDVFETFFTVTATAGALKLQAFECSNPLKFKSIDPAKCVAPDFQIHVLDGAAHLWSNCE